MKLKLLALLFAPLPCLAGPKPCTTPVAASLWSEKLSDMIPAEVDWFNSKMQKKYPCISLQATPTDATRYALVFLVTGENHSGTEIKHSTTTSTVKDQNGNEIGTMDIPTTTNVPYESTVRTYKMAIVDLKADRQPVLHTFFRTQYRQYGAQNLITIIASNKERHPLDGLLKDALKFISEKDKPH